MIYLFSICICLVLAWFYDVLGYMKNKNRWYIILLVWFILVSGFQYMVGTDIPRYMDDYKQFKTALSLNDFFIGIEEHKQPGWILLNWLCIQISDNFVLLKTIHAIILNVAVFTFFKKESKYLFLCIFFYAISSYLVLNFNVMRQSIAMSFGLYAISSIKRDNYAKYAFFSMFAFLFHTSALVLLIIPLFKLIKYSKKALVLIMFFFLAIIYVLLNINIETTINYFVDLGIMGDTMSKSAVDYMSSDRLGTANRESHLSIQFILVILIVVYHYIHEKDFLMGGLGSLYLFVLITTTLMPILWRFRLFFELPYYVLLANVIIKYPHGLLRQVRFAIYAIAIIVFCYYPFRDYFSVSQDSNLKYINQYYPYHSIFDPIEEKRI